MSEASNAPVVVQVPEVIENEDGEVWWAVGHIDPTLMVLATVFEQMVNVDAESAQRILIGKDVRYTDDQRRWTLEDAYAQANGLIQNVRHVWLKQDPNDDDRMNLCEPTTDGAEPWTRLNLFEWDGINPSDFDDTSAPR